MASTRGNLLERAARMIKTGLDASCSKPVTIIDGPDSLESIKAIPGQSSFTTFGVDEHVGTAKTFDWCVAADQLIFRGEKREPKPKWEIHVPLDGNRTAVYIATAQDGGRCFDVMDQLGLLYRIHTVLDRIVPAP